MSCLEFKTEKKENELSWVQDQKKWKWVVLSSGPKKTKMSCLEFKTKKNKNELSWVQDQKKNENELSWVQDQREENELS